MQWGNDIKSKVSLQYNPSGSGAGVAALQAGTVGFAATIRRSAQPTRPV